MTDCYNKLSPISDMKEKTSQQTEYMYLPYFAYRSLIWDFYFGLDIWLFQIAFLA